MLKIEVKIYGRIRMLTTEFKFSVKWSLFSGISIQDILNVYFIEQKPIVYVIYCG